MDHGKTGTSDGNYDVDDRRQFLTAMSADNL